jgi:myo-inositol-1(or 4)-monophosphatase
VDAGFVQNVATADEYYAVKGHGAFRNGKRMVTISHKSRTRSHTFKTLAIECGDIQFIAKMVSKFTTKEVYKLRVLGSAAISLCLIASGSIEGLAFVQPGGARSIDSASGYIIAREAGCLFSDLTDSHRDAGQCRISFDSRINLAVAGSRKKLRALEAILRPAMT